LLKSLEVDLASFDAAVRQNPVDYLNLEPLQTFRATGGVLAPGELLEAYPPYVFKESAEGVSLRAIPTSVRMTFLADLARSIREVPNGTRVPIPLQPSLASSG
jgi:hypothetical protein